MIQLQSNHRPGVGDCNLPLRRAYGWLTPSLRKYCDLADQRFRRVRGPHDRKSPATVSSLQIKVSVHSDGLASHSNVLQYLNSFCQQKTYSIDQPHPHQYLLRAIVSTISERIEFELTDRLSTLRAHWGHYLRSRSWHCWNSTAWHRAGASGNAKGRCPAVSSLEWVVKQGSTEFHGFDWESLQQLSPWHLRSLAITWVKILTLSNMTHIWFLFSSWARPWCSSQPWTSSFQLNEDYPFTAH